ncbi:MAG: hypothetical protein HY403_07985 [Elusimicrobia bacterium]|nr:hypothetical protein [Elusimicrobiota bacterium]
MENVPGSSPVPAAKKRGCLFYLGVAAGLFAAAAILSLVLLISGVRSLLRAYTGTSAVALPVAAMPEAELEALAERVKAFKAKAEGAAGAAETLVLKEDEINALIAREPKLKPFEGKVHVALAGDTIRGRVSVPLDGTGIPFVGGRYLNGEIVLKASLNDGVLIATIDSIVLNEKPFSELVMSALRSENLAKDVYRRPETAEILRKFESAQVKDGMLSIKLRP